MVKYGPFSQMYVRNLEKMEEEVREASHRRRPGLSTGLRCREPQTLGQFRDEKTVPLETGIQREH